MLHTHVSAGIANRLRLQLRPLRIYYPIPFYYDGAHKNYPDINGVLISVLPGKKPHIKQFLHIKALTL